MTYSEIKSDMQLRLSKTQEALKKDFSGLRTGRATTALLDGVMVESYGAIVPLNQVANVAVSDARMLTVSVWDKSMIKKVEKAIVEAGLGLNPMNDGIVIRIPIPISSCRRREYCRRHKLSVSTHPSQKYYNRYYIFYILQNPNVFFGLFV